MSRGFRFSGRCCFRFFGGCARFFLSYGMRGSGATDVPAAAVRDVLDGGAHTYVIHHYQSGLHGLPPGRRADWSADEGVAAGTGEEPARARSSTPWAPRTITSLSGRIPEAWFAR